MPVSCAHCHSGSQNGSHSGVMSRPVGDIEAAHAALGVAHRSRPTDCFHVVVGNVGEPDAADRDAALQKSCEPVVVDAQHLDRRLVDRSSRPLAPRMPYSTSACTPSRSWSLQPQIGVGQAADALLAVVVEAGRGHPVGAVDDCPARIRGRPSPCRSSGRTWRRLALTHSGPFGPSITWGMRSLSAAEALAGEQVGRQPDQIDMAIGGDDVVFHGRDPPRDDHRLRSA